MTARPLSTVELRWGEAREMSTAVAEGATMANGVK